MPAADSAARHIATIRSGVRIRASVDKPTICGPRGGLMSARQSRVRSGDLMTTNPLLARWRAGQPTLGGWMVTADAQVAEFMAAAGFDEICVDQQHGLADGSTIADVFRAIE